MQVTKQKLFYDTNTQKKNAANLQLTEIHLREFSFHSGILIHFSYPLIYFFLFSTQIHIVRVSELSLCPFFVDCIFYSKNVWIGKCDFV